MNTSTLSRGTALTRALCAAALGVWLAGCSSIPLGSDVPVETRTPTAVGGTGSGAGASGTSDSKVTSVDLTNDSNKTDASGLPHTIYFDYNSYAVKDADSATIAGYAKLLTSDPKKKLQVEGHTDERGGSEYNLALGQKRAQAVAKSLALLGASELQVEAVSFGKERPAVQGSDEAAWAKNRRAELNLR